MAHRGKMELLSRDLLIAAGEVPADCPITGPGGCKYETRLLRWMEKQRGAGGGFPGGADGVLARAFDVLTRRNERDNERKQALAAANVAGGKKKGKKKSAGLAASPGVQRNYVLQNEEQLFELLLDALKKHNDKHAGGSSGQSRGTLASSGSSTYPMHADGAGPSWDHSQSTPSLTTTLASLTAPSAQDGALFSLAKHESSGRRSRATRHPAACSHSTRATCHGAARARCREHRARGSHSAGRSGGGQSNHEP